MYFDMFNLDEFSADITPVQLDKKIFVRTGWTVFKLFFNQTCFTGIKKLSIDINLFKHEKQGLKALAPEH